MSSRSQALLSALLVGGMVAAAPPVGAQDNETLRGAAEAIEERGEVGAVEPGALEALQAMGAHVGELMNFELTSDFEVDLVLENDHLIQINGTSHYLARRPDRLRMELSTDTGNREFIYDGQSLHVVSPDDQVYGTLNEVGPTIRQMLLAVDYYADIQLPLAELFSLGSEDTLDRVVTEGFLVGPSMIGTATTSHWAYRTADRDVQVWIQDGDAPLPLRVVVEDKTQDGKPRFEATLTWNTNVQPTEDQFVFTPPVGSTEITFAMRDPDADGVEAAPEEVVQ